MARVETEVVSLVCRLANALMIRTQDYERQTSLRAEGARALLGDAMHFAEVHRDAGEPHPLSALRAWLTT